MMLARMSRRRWAGLLVCAWLAACATPRGEQAPAAADALFAVEGRMSVVTIEDDARPRSTTGRFTWVEYAGRSEIALYSPFGETLARIEVAPWRSVMRTPQAIEQAATPEALVDRVLGFTLPVSGLRDWMRGRSRRGVVLAPQTFDEDGWRISFPRMQDDQALPRIVRLERGQPSAVEVRLVIDRWDLPADRARSTMPGDAPGEGARP